MKKRLLINGTMGVGKTETCKELLALLPHSALLDGDWCWTMNPWVINDETRKMVEDNIACVLKSFLSCSIFQQVIFCWVMHQKSIIDSVLLSLGDAEFELHIFTLVCSEEALKKRLLADKSRIVEQDTIMRSLERLPLYESMDTEKVDTTHISARQTAEKLAQSIGRK
ncbi:MAG: AAA family ATPase [Alphaproteobacteria bacterium]|nr:AAA family ATPase [Alphaproteobacteria bacterium]